jgi:Mn2+/Fe2+ NRAMP family transporter
MVALAQRVGPGLLFASTAVGVSHLVQSTRAGAEFGLSMAVLILVACAVKYPAFRFGAEYAAAAKESIIVAYERQGGWLLVFFLLAIAVEGLAVIPAVSLVAAGMTMSFVGLQANEVLVTTAIIVVASLGLAFGRYRLLENLSKVFVVLFAVLTLVATVGAVGAFGDGRALALPVALSRENLFFSVAVAGWMPVGMGGAVFLSLWVRAKSEALGRPVTVEEARFDFNVGYVGTVVLALCFLLIGTALLLGRGIDIPASSVGFAAQLFALFAQSVGGWVTPVIGICALAVMFSTVLAVIDGFPRVYANVTNRLLGPAAAIAEDRLYLAFMIVQALVAFLLLGLFLRSFAVFIDYSTTAGFVIAPAIAFLNHRVICSAAVAVEHRPPPWLKAWSAAGVAVLTGASVAYLYFRFA